MYTTETYPVRHIVFHKRMSLEKDSVQPVKSRKYFSNLMLYTILIKGNNLHSKIGQRVQHSASCMLTKSCPKAVVTATMKGCLTLTIFVTLVSTEVTVISIISSDNNKSIIKSLNPFVFILGLIWNCEEWVECLLNVQSHYVGAANGLRVSLLLKFEIWQRGLWLLK